MDEHDKLEPTAVFMDPKFAAYLQDELLAVHSERNKIPAVFLKRYDATKKGNYIGSLKVTRHVNHFPICRNKRKLSTGDEIVDTWEAMEGLVIHNGVEMKVHSQTKKVTCTKLIILRCLYTVRNMQFVSAFYIAHNFLLTFVFLLIFCLVCLRLLMF